MLFFPPKRTLRPGTILFPLQALFLPDPIFFNLTHIFQIYIFTWQHLTQPISNTLLIFLANMNTGEPACQPSQCCLFILIIVCRILHCRKSGQGNKTNCCIDQIKGSQAQKNVAIGLKVFEETRNFFEAARTPCMTCNSSSIWDSLNSFSVWESFRQLWWPAKHLKSESGPKRVSLMEKKKKMLVGFKKNVKDVLL